MSLSVYETNCNDSCNLKRFHFAPVYKAAAKLTTAQRRAAESSTTSLWMRCAFWDKLDHREQVGIYCLKLRLIVHRESVQTWSEGVLSLFAHFLEKLFEFCGQTSRGQGSGLVAWPSSHEHNTWGESQSASVQACFFPPHCSVLTRM